MRINLIVILVINILFFNCQSIIKKNPDNSCAIQKELPENKTVISMGLVNGIWAENEEENAIFWIKNDLVYFLDSQDNPFPFYINGDSLIFAKENLYIKWSIIKLTDDSLFLSNEFIDDTLRL